MAHNINCMLDRLFQILAADWLIHQDTVLSYLPAFIAFLNGAKFELKAEIGPKPYIRAFNTDGTPDLISTVGKYDLSDKTIPENSVAIIPIQGPIYNWETMQLINNINAAKENPQISSILFMVSSPGGMVSQLDIAANTIKNLSIPTVATIFEMSASAAMWLISSMSYRIATSPMDQIGSIGIMTSIADMSGLLKDKLGIVITDLYATKSTEKNAEIRAFLEKGNKDLVTAKLDFINNYFHAQVQKNLGIKADSEVFTGAIYFAEKAKGLGLIDEINTMDYALNYAYNLGIKNKISTFSKNLINKS